MQATGIGIGVSNFRELRRSNNYYVDKSFLIEELITTGDRVTLLPRPRRFGKTLNLSMLRYFFEKDYPGQEPANNAELFQGLAIAKTEVFEKHQGQYPVIFLSFRNIKGESFKEVYRELQNIIWQEAKRHKYLLQGEILDTEEKQTFQGFKDYPSDMLKNLIVWLNRYHKEQVVILIDEYDTPLQDGYLNGYYEKARNFFRSFLGGLKDMDDLIKKAVITGILRVAKESIFSDLNNPGVYSILSRRYSTQFGFTEEEAKKILKDHGLEALEEKVRKNYNGYIFGDKIIYNPWSFMNYVKNPQDGFNAYWANTASPELIKRLIVNGPSGLKDVLVALLRGETIELDINEMIVFSELKSSKRNIISLLLYSGYLKAKFKRQEEIDKIYGVSIPNLELKKIYKQIILSWVSGESFGEERFELLQKSLLEGRIKEFEVLLQEQIETVFSSHDFQKEPECVYQAFILGLLANKQYQYEIRSNRESGRGRYDVLIVPRKDLQQKYSVIVELKRRNKRLKGSDGSLDDLAQKAFGQIEEKKYEAELLDRGVPLEKIIKVGIAFEGKELVVVSNFEEDI